LPAQTACERLNTYAAADTQRVRLLSDCAWDITESQPLEAAAKLWEAIALARRLNFLKGEAAAWNGLGVVAETQDSLLRAIEYYQYALALRQSLGDAKSVASTLNNIAVVHEYLGDFGEALKTHRESLRIVEALGDKPRMARAHLNLSGVFEEEGAYPEAYEQVNAARAIFEELRDSASIAKCYTLLGHIRFELEMYSESMRWYELALRAKERLGDSATIANAISDLGNVLDEMGNQDSSRAAVQLYLRALSIRQSLDDQAGIAALYNNLGIAYKHLGQYEKGWDYLRRALAMRTAAADQPGLMEVYNSIGDVVYGQKKYREALAWTERYFKIAQAIGDQKFIQKAYKDFAKIYASMGDFATAYEYRVQYDELRYKRLDEARARDFERKDVLFSEGKKEREIERQRSELALRDAQIGRSRTTRNALIGGAFLLVLLIGLLMSRNRIRARANRLLAAQNEAIERERQRADGLLKNILPAAAAEELKQHNVVQPTRYESVTVLFSDFKGFTTIAEQLTPEDLVTELDECFRLFDSIVERYNLEKIKTIGDAYMCAGGLPTPNETHASDMVHAALDMLRELADLMVQKKAEGKPVFEMRIGIHSGPVVAGVVGSRKFAYDIWGDTVNTAARLEQGGEPGKINISGATWEQVRSEFACTFRGNLPAKNKGEIPMYFVDNQR
jgi:class 3 adenylate cyclase